MLKAYAGNEDEEAKKDAKKAQKAFDSGLQALEQAKLSGAHQDSTPVSTSQTVSAPPASIGASSGMASAVSPALLQPAVTVIA